jgi:hypothetical protein
VIFGGGSRRRADSAVVGGGGDVTAPNLENPVDTASVGVTATGSVDTNEGNGTL